MRAIRGPVGLCFALLLLLGSTPAANAAGKTWLLIDTVAQRIAVYRGQQLLKRFYNISIGRGGAAPYRTDGDNTTPKGEFHIDRINHDSEYHLFFGLDFPNVRYAKQGVARGDLDEQQYNAIVNAIQSHQAPPQNTPLGGYIGIHGLGSADLALHERLNWTRGCIALTDHQIDELARLVGLGTRVVIR